MVCAAAPNALRDALPTEAPEEPESYDAIAMEHSIHTAVATYSCNKARSDSCMLHVPTGANPRPVLVARGRIFPLGNESKRFSCM